MASCLHCKLDGSRQACDHSDVRRTRLGRCPKRPTRAAQLGAVSFGAAPRNFKLKCRGQVPALPRRRRRTTPAAARGRRTQTYRLLRENELLDRRQGPSCVEAPGASIVGAIAIPFEVAMAEFVIAIYAFWFSSLLCTSVPRWALEQHPPSSVSCPGGYRSLTCSDPLHGNRRHNRKCTKLQGGRRLLGQSGGR